LSQRVVRRKRGKGKQQKGQVSREKEGIRGRRSKEPCLVLATASTGSQEERDVKFEEVSLVQNLNFLYK
jgi:hypothetical protein